MTMFNLTGWTASRERGNTIELQKHDGYWYTSSGIFMVKPKRFSNPPSQMRGQREDHLLLHNSFHQKQLINENNREKSIYYIERTLSSFCRAACAIVESPADCEAQNAATIALHNVFNQSKLIKKWLNEKLRGSWAVLFTDSISIVCHVGGISEICLTFLWAKPIILFICSCSQCVCGCVALSGSGCVRDNGVALFPLVFSKQPTSCLVIKRNFFLTATSIDLWIFMDSMFFERRFVCSTRMQQWLVA